MRERGYSDARDQDAVGHPRPVLRLRVQQGAQRRLRAGLLLDRLPEGQLPRRVHGGAAHQRRRRQGQAPRSTWPSAGGWASRSCRPTSTSPHGRLLRRRRRHPLRAGRRAQRRAERRRRRSSRRARRRAVHRLLRLPAQGRRGRVQQEDGRVADQGRRVRLARPHPPRPARRARRRDRRVHGRPSATRRSASSTCSARSATVRRAPGSRHAADPAGEWDKAELLAFEREMLGLYVSDHPLFGLEHVAAPARPTCPIAALADEGTVADGKVVTARRHPVRRAAADHQAGPPVGLGDPGGPRRRGRGDVLPQHLRAGRAVRRRGRDRGGARAGSTGARSSPA